MSVDPGRRRRRGGGRGDDGSREQPMVPRAEFRSYYGMPVLKPTVWKNDIAYYFFLGGVSAGSSLLGAGADLTGRPALRKGSRVAALVSLLGGTYFLVHDLGRPERFHHMLRVVKLTSPMSLGTWVLSVYAAPMGVAALSELMPARVRGSLPGRLIDSAARPSGLAAASLAPAVASYTAVLLSHTAVPAWNEVQAELPFVFTGSATAASGGLGMILAPVREAGPARRMAVLGAAAELVASHRMETRHGIVDEAFEAERPRRYLRAARGLTTAGALGAALLARRSRTAAVLSGAALMAASVCERLGVLHAGIESATDPRYVVEPQRRRLEERAAEEREPRKET